MTLVLSHPGEIAHDAHPVWVARWAGRGFVFDWGGQAINGRFIVEAVENGVDGHYPRAVIRVNPAGDYADGAELLPELAPDEFVRAIDPDERVCVFCEPKTSDAADRARNRQFLFDGFLTVPEIEQTEHELQYRITATSLVERAADRREAWLNGRVMAFSRDGGTTLEHHRVLAAPVAFNAEGRPNRHPDLHVVGGVIDVPLFTYDGAPDAAWWTLADVLKYLLVIHFDPAAAAVGLIDGNGKERVRYWVAQNAGPQVLDADSARTWDDTMQAASPEMTVEGASVLDALELWCRAGGCRMAQVTLNDGTGEPVTQLLFWKAGEGGPWISAGPYEERIVQVGQGPSQKARPLLLPPEGAPVVGWYAEAQRLHVIYDHANVLSSCRRIGSALRHEVTLGRACATEPRDVFLPGWLPDAMAGDGLWGTELEEKIDQTRAVRFAEEGDAQTMRERYAGGSDAVQYRDVLRRWVLNESGEYDGDDYGRTNGLSPVWEAAAYATPYDFHALAGVPTWVDPDTLDVRRWAPRRRAIENLISEPRRGQGVAPILEISFDSGVHWYLAHDRLSWAIDAPTEGPGGGIAIRLTDQDLSQVGNEWAYADPEDEAAGYSVWEAILRGTFRVALTCAVTGDDMVIGDAAAKQRSWGGYARHTQSIARQRTLRKDSLANSRLAGETGWESGEEDLGDQAAAQAAALLAARRDRVISASVSIPYLSTDWLPGDLCTGVPARGLDFRTHQDLDRYPEVVRVRWESGESQQTLVTLGDHRTVVKGL